MKTIAFFSFIFVASILNSQEADLNLKKLPSVDLRDLKGKKDEYL